MSLSDNVKGAALMSGSMAGYTLNDVCMKAISMQLPLSQAIFLRGVLTCLMLYGLGRYMRSLSFDLAWGEWKLIGLRACAEIGGTYFFLSALFHMPIANATAILQSLPLTVSLAAWLFLREPLGWRRFVAILIGFFGVILIVQPTGEGFSIWSVYALIAVAFITFRDLVVRKMSRKTPTMTVAFATAVAITISFGLLSTTVEWAPVNGTTGPYLLCAAMFIFVGYILAVMVMRVGDISFVAPFRYTGLIWALFAGLLLFGEWPDALTIFGTIIVVSMGLFTLFRERRI